MAEGFARYFSKDSLKIDSAGTNPVDEINPLVVEAMKEKGIDISYQIPKLLTEKMVKRVGKMITMGCSIEQECPALHISCEDWEINDPKGKTIEEIRDIRDQIEISVRLLFSGT